MGPHTCGRSIQAYNGWDTLEETVQDRKKVDQVWDAFKKSDHGPACMCHCIFFGINPRVSKHHAFRLRLRPYPSLRRNTKLTTLPTLCITGKLDWT